MAWLLDSNVISELRKPNPERKVLNFVSATPLSDLYVSIVSLAEIWYSIELSSDPHKRSALQDWLTVKVRPMFDLQRTLPVTEDILLKWRVFIGRWTKIRSYFFATRSSHCRDSRASWSNCCEPRPNSFRARRCPFFQSLGSRMTLR